MVAYALKAAYVIAWRCMRLMAAYVINGSVCDCMDGSAHVIAYVTVLMDIIMSTCLSNYVERLPLESHLRILLSYRWM